LFENHFKQPQFFNEILNQLVLGARKTTKTKILTQHFFSNVENLRRHRNSKPNSWQCNEAASNTLSICQILSINFSQIHRNEQKALFCDDFKEEITIQALKN